MSDVMHGPTVLDAEDRRRHKTYLIALLDDATRMIPSAAFTRSETVTAFLPVFERALLRRGIPIHHDVRRGRGHDHNRGLLRADDGRRGRPVQTTDGRCSRAAS